jgi:hypothetical protein
MSIIVMILLPATVPNVGFFHPSRYDESELTGRLMWKVSTNCSAFQFARIILFIIYSIAV